MPGSTRFGAGGRGKLTLIRPVNSKTSLFRKLATTGARLIEVKLIGKASTTHNHQWCVYSLTGTKITQSGTTSDPLPVEEITLNYEEIKWTYNNTANSRSESFNLAYVEIKWDYPSSGR
ncbi:type VI secretion system tube protein Hcp [uncultured Paraglaciecola sp.]|uniref:type VI secretion system tube protein Hcp n=1 Tax=uncultured Paraglaciecola sp. TaxID=1765024 RepID=UPI0030DB96DF